MKPLETATLFDSGESRSRLASITIPLADAAKLLGVPPSEARSLLPAAALADTTAIPLAAVLEARRQKRTRRR